MNVDSSTHGYDAGCAEANADAAGEANSHSHDHAHHGTDPGWGAAGGDSGEEPAPVGAFFYALTELDEVLNRLNAMCIEDADLSAGMVVSSMPAAAEKLHTLCNRVDGLHLKLVGKVATTAGGVPTTAVDVATPTPDHPSE